MANLEDLLGYGLERNGSVFDVDIDVIAQKQYVDDLIANFGKRQQVRVATTANITISTALNNADTLDGISLVTGDLVLVKDQTTKPDNGIYVVGVSPARDTNFDTFDEHVGSLISVASGTANAGRLWLGTVNAGGSLGVTDIVFGEIVIAGDVVGPASSTDNAFARFDSTTGKLLQDSVGATLDDAGRAIFKSMRIPPFDAGNSGTSKTLDFNDGNEQLLTLTGNVTLTLSNPGDGGRYVIVLLQDGTGGRTVTWPASVLWPDGSTPVITPTIAKRDLVTLMYLSGAAKYLASINQNY